MYVLGKGMSRNLKKMKYNKFLAFLIYFNIYIYLKYVIRVWVEQVLESENVS